MLGTSKNIWGFDPRSVPGCQLWLDGADSNTVTGTTSVTAWNDKSGNGYVANSFVNSVSNPSWVSNVQNGNGVIQYSAGNGSSIANFVLAQTMSIFKVYYPINQNTGSPFIEHGPNVNNESGFYFHAQGGQNFAIRNESGQVPVNPVNFGNTTISNTWQMIQGINPDPSNSNAMTFYLNGTVKASSATTGSGTSILTKTLYINGRGGANNLSYNTYLAELIIYNIGVTTSQRQQIEGYLSHKWGLTTSIPSIHPFSSIRPHLRIFQPTDIPGCQLWLDGADQSSLVLSGSNVTQWSDKSGNGYNMNTLTPTAGWSGSAAYPTIGTSINGLQTVNFKAQSGLKQATTLDGVKNLFWVGRIAAAVGSTSGGFANFFLLGHDSHYDWHPPIGEKFILSGVAQSGIADASPASLFTNDPNAVTNTVFSSINLPSPPNVSLLSVAGITGTTRYQGICYDRQTHTGWCGDLAEVLIFNTALTTSQRQQVEGYLAHKWGLTLYLPVISPLSIPGCSLWLDGADPAGTGVTPSNGATVSTWVDKATAKNATATGTPTYVSGGGVNFNGSSYFLNQAFTMNLSQRSIFIVMQETSRTTSVGVVSFIPNPSSGQDYATTTGLAIETVNGLRFLGNFTNGGYYLSVFGNSTLLVKAIYNDNMNGTTGSGYLNGTNSTNVTADYTASTCSGYIVGKRWTENLYLNGVIYEIIVFNTPLTTSQRQSIEGYLARKWGISISATLPSPHPFKSFPPAKAPMIIGLVNRWIFNNGSGSTVTDTVGGQNISLSGTYTWSSSVPNSEIAIDSLSFDGYTGTGSASPNATLQTSTYTMTLWYYHTGNSDPRGGNPIMIETGFNQNEAFAFATGGFDGRSKPYFFSSVYNGGFFRQFSSETPLNTWTHLAVTIGNSTYNAYQNGVLDSENTNISITSGLPFTLNGSFVFGKGDNAYGDQFGGSLFDVRIYNRALSASEISQIYNGIG